MFALSRLLVIVMLTLGLPHLGAAQGTSGGVTFGLSGVRDYSSQHPFIDIMRTARGWTGHLPGQWGGWGHDDLERGGYLDADGWLVAVPAQLESVGLLLLTDLPEDARSFEGEYRLTYEGQGELELRGRGRLRAQKPGEIRFHFSPAKGLVELRINETDPQGTGDYIRNIRIIKVDDVAAFEAGARFNSRYLERLDAARGVRFMDWMRTNDSEQVHWKDRPRIDDYTWSRNGIPVEVMVELANTLGADPWFTLPHLADDDHIRRFAEMVQTRLSPRLRAHVEFSNEVWNRQFAQARWAEEQALERWGEEHRGPEYYGKRAAEMAAIWADVFGDEAEARLVRVIATHTGWLGRERAILNAPLWVAEAPDKHRPPHTFFDAYAVTGYFDGGLGRDAAAAQVLEWIAQSREAAEQDADALGLTRRAREEHIAAHRFDLATDIAAHQLRDGTITGDAQGSVRHLLDEVLPYHARVARDHGLDLLMYEGGTHVAGVGPLAEENILTEFFIHLNYSAQMGALYDELLAGWAALTDAPFNAYVDVAKPSKWGSWGALRHLEDDNPRWRALMRHAQD